jgi:signal transduction histidine kinase
MTGAEPAHFLGNIESDAARLSQLVIRLLDLARADMTRPCGEAPGFEVAVLSDGRELHAAPAAAIETVRGTLSL